jgi:hypothetical protein
VRIHNNNNKQQPNKHIEQKQNKQTKKRSNPQRKGLPSMFRPDPSYSFDTTRKTLSISRYSPSGQTHAEIKNELKDGKKDKER